MGSGMKDNLRPIKDFEGLYSITSDGRIWSHGRDAILGKTGARSFPAKWLKSSPDAYGYRIAKLRKEGRQYTLKVHRLVLETWVGSAPTPDHVVNHKDFVRDNNHVDNLEWVTQKENVRHTVDQGRHFSPFGDRGGEKHHKAKFTVEQILKVRLERSKGVTYKSLAERYGVAISTIFSVCRHESWKMCPNEWVPG
jgi:hypothetical protein